MKSPLKYLATLANLPRGPRLDDGASEYSEQADRILRFLRQEHPEITAHQAHMAIQGAIGKGYLTHHSRLGIYAGYKLPLFIEEAQNPLCSTTLK